MREVTDTTTHLVCSLEEFEKDGVKNVQSMSFQCPYFNQSVGMRISGSLIYIHLALYMVEAN